jgi:hypothetical protein
MLGLYIILLLVTYSSLDVYYNPKLEVTEGWFRVVFKRCLISLRKPIQAPSTYG